MGIRVDALTSAEVIPCAVRTATVNGAAVNVREYVGRVAFTLASAAMTTADTLDVKIQGSADGSTGWADVAGATFAQVTDAADAYETITVEIGAHQPYVRAVGTIAGTTPSVAFSVGMMGAKQNL